MLTQRQLREVRVGHRIRRRDPLGHFLRIERLHPPVRIRNIRATVVIDDIAPVSDRVCEARFGRFGLLTGGSDEREPDNR
jgi:hypothetical protein